MSRGRRRYRAIIDGELVKHGKRGVQQAGAELPAWDRVCGYCGRPFVAGSPNARYCSHSHRELAYRARRRALGLDDGATTAALAQLAKHVYFGGFWPSAW